MASIPKSFLSVLTWPVFFYRQQEEFLLSSAWQTWFIAANGTGKTLIARWSEVAQMLGVHPKQIAPPPIKVRSLVPSFDHVEDVALEKLLAPQRIEFAPPLSESRTLVINDLISQDYIKEYDLEKGWILLPPLISSSMIKKRGGFSKEHKGIELKDEIGGSSIWFVTSEQGWQAQRGGEQDILSMDEEGSERVFDELKRGLRNAKGGGKIYATMTPPVEAGQGPTWTKEKVLDASISDKSITVIHACMADNPAISPQFIKEFSKNKTQKQINAQIYGIYPTWGDLVHPEFQDRKWSPETIDGHVLPNDTPMPDNFDVDWVMSFDWHQSKPTAAIWGFIDSDGNIIFYDELDKELAEGKTIAELSEIFKGIEG
jgi:hypothetical protein